MRKPLWLVIVALVAGWAATGASFVGAGGSSECEKKAAARPTHDCVSCDASVACLERVSAAGGSAEILPIATGLMVIYSTPNAKRVAEVQNAALERWGVTDAVVAGKAEGHLCASCCAARTLMLRSDRQIYRTATGVIALVTSEDYTIVRELHRMVPKRRVVTPEP